MKFKLLLILTLFILTGLFSIAQENIVKKEPAKPYIQSDYPPLRSGGDNIGNAVEINALPFTDGGTTCGATDDYAANCGCCGGSNGAPDLVYSISPNGDGMIDIHLTGNYDVLVHVRDSQGNVIACDDDSGGIDHAIITNLALVSGETYYIVAEGFSSGCGDYTLNVTGTVPVGVPVSPWAIGIAVFLIVSLVVFRFAKMR